MALRIIAGSLRGRLLQRPPGRAVRPTADRVREALFSILADRVEDRVVYDLFAGTGALGIEALSRGARQAVFVERDRRVAQLLRRNLRELGLEAQADVVVADAFRWVSRHKSWPADPTLVLLGPPYDEFQHRPRHLAELVGILQSQLSPGSIIVVQHPRRYDVGLLPMPQPWQVRRYGETQIALWVSHQGGAGKPTGEIVQEHHPDLAAERSERPAKAHGLPPLGLTSEAVVGEGSDRKLSASDLRRSSAMSPKERFARQVVERLQKAGFRALWAGGCVRDLLRGREPEDYDVATDARPPQVRKLFRRTIEVGAAFGVVEVLGPPGAGTVQVATFRSDVSYSDGRHPDRVEYGTAEADAQRRDFTINGMFYDPLRGEPLDYVGGRQDLAKGIVRAIGDPVARFEEDKLRLLRAVRFSAAFGFPLEPQTERALRALAAEIRVVSAERIAEELRRMLVHPTRALAMRLAFDLGLISAILPELVPLADLPLADMSRSGPPGVPGVERSEPPDPRASGGPGDPPAGSLWDHTLAALGKLDESVAEVSKQGPLSDPDKPRSHEESPPAGADPATGPAPSAVPPVPFTLALAALLHEAAAPPLIGLEPQTAPEDHHDVPGRDIARAVCRRLKLPNTETDRIGWLVEHHMYLAQARALRTAKLKRILVHEAIDELLALHWADAAASTGDTSQVAYCLQLLRDLPPEELNPPPLIDGHDLIRLGVPEGPIRRQLLEAVRDAQLDGRVQSKAEALDLVNQGLQSQVPPGDS